MDRRRFLTTKAIGLFLVSAVIVAGASQQDNSDRRGEGRFRKLTPEEINRVRFMELRTLRLRDEREVDRVRVLIPRDVSTAFLDDMAGRPRFEGREARRRFLRLRPEQKLAIIAHESKDKYADRIQIRTDPEVFFDFRTRVMPIILRGCATSKCHGGSNAPDTGFVLYDDLHRSADTTYTNFLALDEYVLDKKEGEDTKRYYMIDRGRPNDSLLLAWLVRSDQTPMRVKHPGDKPIKEVFLNQSKPGYRLIRDWIDDLDVPRPDFRVRLSPGPDPPDGAAPNEADQEK